MPLVTPTPSQQVGLQQAAHLFATGQYFECHEVLETQVWGPETDLSLKKYYQGLIQLAVAMHHYQQQNVQGLQLQVHKAFQSLMQGIVH